MIGSSMAPATSTTPAVETWRPVVGWEDLYEISDHGQVRSVECDTIRYKKGKPTTYHKRQQLRKQKRAANGYMLVCLHRDSTEKTCLVHRLVAEAFIPNPDNLPEVNHKDTCKSNNNIENLEWCDRLYNVNYADAREKHTQAVSHPIEQLTLQGEHIAYFSSTKALHRLTNGAMHGRNIARVLKGESQTAYGYRWRYVEGKDITTLALDEPMGERYKRPVNARIEQLTMQGEHVAFFDGMMEAVNKLGYSKTAIWQALNGKNKSSYGYKWRYVE